MRTLLMTTAIILALTAGGAYAEKADKDEGQGGPRYEATLSKLPADKRELVRSAYRKEREESKAQRDELKALRDEQRALAGAEKFDKAAYLANVKKQTQLQETLHMRMGEAKAAVLEQLTPEERKVMAEESSRNWKKRMGEKRQKPEAEKTEKPKAD